MLICLDYDGTYTEDPALWDQFIENAITAGHVVICATMRYQAEGADVERDLGLKVAQIIYTDRQAKQPYLRNRGINPDIWIDDSPYWLLNGSR